MPTNVKPDALADGDYGASVVLTAAEARNCRIPLRKQQYPQAGQDPHEGFSEARRACEAALLDDEVTPREALGAVASSSTAPATIGAPPPEVLYEYMWKECI